MNKNSNRSRNTVPSFSVVHVGNETFWVLSDVVTPETVKANPPKPEKKVIEGKVA